MDDIITIGVYDKNNSDTYINTKKLLDDFEEKCYHKDLTLEKEKIIDSQLIFLEGEIFFDDKNEIDMKYKNKNWMTLGKEFYQKFQRYTHWKSYSPGKVKRSIVFGAISRIMLHSTKKYHFIQSIIKLFLGLSFLSYPWNFLKKIMNDKMYM